MPVIARVSALLLLLALAGAPDASADAGTLQLSNPVDRVVGAPLNTFMDMTIVATVPNRPLDVVLAGDKAGTRTLVVDDILDLVVTRPDGSQTSLTHDFSVGCAAPRTPSEPLNVGPLLRPGRNRVRVVLRDACGPTEGNSRLFLVGNVSFSIPEVTRGWAPPKPFPLPQTILGNGGIANCVNGAIGVVYAPDPTFYGPQAAPDVPTGPYSLAQLKRFYDAAERVTGAVSMKLSNYVCGTGRVQVKLQEGHGKGWKDVASGKELSVPSDGYVTLAPVTGPLKTGKEYRLQFLWGYVKLGAGDGPPEAEWSWKSTATEGRVVKAHAPETLLANPSFNVDEQERLEEEPDALSWRGLTVTGIRWKHWGERQATGTGKGSVNTCKPSCADGNYVEGKVSLKAFHPYMNAAVRRVYGCMTGEVNAKKLKESIRWPPGCR